MPKPTQLKEFGILLRGGYFPGAPALAPEEYQFTIRAGDGVWLLPGGKLRVAKGLLETSSTNVGARIFAANIQRATIAGGLIGNRLPYAGLLRYDNAVIFFVHEEAGKQVYIDESAPVGFTTSPTPGRLRIAVPDGVGGFSTVADAGFEKPTLSSSDVAVATSVDPNRDMVGTFGVALAPWRTVTDAIGPPSDPVFVTTNADTAAVIRITLQTPAAGQDGWIYCGTRSNDRNGELREVRRVRLAVRGTFTATNGIPTLTAGSGTFFTQDLRRSDRIVIDGGNYNISSVESDTQATLTGNFTGLTGSGKTGTLNIVDGSWLDGELGPIITRDIIRAPRCAGVLNYAGTVFAWGCFGERGDSPTGPVILPTAQFNPEHFLTKGIRTASGSDLVNVLGGDGPLYLMTTTSLEVANNTNDPETPYIPKIIAEPGFKAATNGCLYLDYFYGFNGGPMRTRADENIDTEFATQVAEEMESWNGERVIVERDPKKQAVLYIYDNGTTSTVRPFLTNQGFWSPPLNFPARILDAQVVGGELYLTYLNGGNIRVNRWEGGTGITGDRYISTQLLDPNLLNANRLKRIAVVGKVGSVSVFTVEEGEDVPDVSDIGQAAETFPLSDTASKFQEEIGTNIESAAIALRVNFTSADGSLDKLVVRGLSR